MRGCCGDSYSTPSRIRIAPIAEPGRHPRGTGNATLRGTESDMSYAGTRFEADVVSEWQDFGLGVAVRGVMSLCETRFYTTRTGQESDTSRLHGVRFLT